MCYLHGADMPVSAGEMLEATMCYCRTDTPVSAGAVLEARMCYCRTDTPVSAGAMLEAKMCHLLWVRYASVGWCDVRG